MADSLESITFTEAELITARELEVAFSDGSARVFSVDQLRVVQPIREIPAGGKPGEGSAISRGGTQ